MKEKKTFILAVPTLIIFVVVVVGICMIFYKTTMVATHSGRIAPSAPRIENIS